MGTHFFRGPDFSVYLLGLDGRVINKWGTPADEIVWAKPIFDPGGDILTLTGIKSVPGYAIPLPYKMAQYDVEGNLFSNGLTSNWSAGNSSRCTTI